MFVFLLFLLSNVFTLVGYCTRFTLACLQTLPRAAAFADDFNLLGVARSVITDELQAAFLGASRSAAIGTAVAAADGIPDWLCRSAAMFHVVVTVLFLPACRR